MATYHVNPITGSDTTGNGTALNPWLTIKFAVTSGATNGDTIKVTGTSTTDVDTAATFTNPNSAIINTSVNLTSQFVVGDICIISPKYAGAPEFDGWMIYEVRGVTSTTLDLGNTRNPFPNASTHAFTISKFDTYVNCGASGNIEDFSTGVTVNSMAGITIVGGYDNTFTNIIGTTVYRRTGLAYNAAAGSIFKPYTQTTAKGNTFARFENFTVSKFTDCFRNSFSASIIATNINNHGITNAGPSSGCFYLPGEITNIYVSNSGWNQNGSYSFGGGVSPAFYGESCNAYINQQNKIVTFTNTIVNNITGWTNTLNANSAPFSNSGLINGVGYAHQGSLSFIPLDASRGNGFSTAVYGTGNITMNPTSIKIVNDGATASGNNSTTAGAPLSYNIMYASNANDSILSAGVLTLPSGFSIENFDMKLSRDTISYNNPQLQFLNIVDGNNVWNSAASSAYSTTDTLVFDTGDSSKKILLPMKSYANTTTIATLLTFLKTGSIASVTIRYKSSINITSGSIGLGGPLLTPTNNTILTESKQIPLSVVWTDLTFNIDASTSAYKSFELLNNNTPITFCLSFNIPDAMQTEYLWIDSVTIS